MDEKEREELEKIEEELRAKEEERKKGEMLVSGKSVFEIKRIKGENKKK